MGIWRKLKDRKNITQQSQKQGDATGIEEKFYSLYKEIIEMIKKTKDNTIETFDFETRYSLLCTQSKMLDIICEYFPYALLELEYNKEYLGREIQELLSLLEKDKEQLELLQKEEGILRKEIIGFTNIITEVSSRYKLSPTWEGKKPILIQKQKELEERRNDYVLKEKEMYKRLESHSGNQDVVNKIYLQIYENIIKRIKKDRQ